MSTTVDRERSEMGAESRNERARRRISECMEVNRLTYEGLSVTLIAQRLGFSRDKVRALQFWLGWRHSNMKWAVSQRNGSRWAARYPGESNHAA